MWIVLILFIHAQQEVYSPQKYSDQTKHCAFQNLTLAPDLIAEDSLSLEKLMQAKKSHPLSSPWIDQDLFLDKLGEALFKNEANCKTIHLTHWGKSEEFPSMGLPHAIWYNQNTSKKYQEQFPELIRFIHKNLKSHEKVQLTWPVLLAQNPLPPAPWKNQKEFAQIQNVSLKIEATMDSVQLLALKKQFPLLYPQAYQLFEIRHFLSNPIVLRLQAKYVVEKTFYSLHRILAMSEKKSPEMAQALYLQMQRLLSSQEGVLSLVDYLNFKGEGIKASERTPVLNHSWGLAVVLELMGHIKSERCLTPSKIPGACTNNQFAEAALCALQRLAYHSGEPSSPAQTQRYLWLNGGWKTRVETNYRPGTFTAARCKKDQTQPPVTTSKSESL